MFKNNKYTDCYFRLINKRKEYIISNSGVYTENHHIIPRSIGGSDDATNIVTLTAKEHFIAHLLLTKMHDSISLAQASFMMTVVNDNQGKRYKCTSRTYAHLKSIMSEATRERMTGSSGNVKGRTKYYNKHTLQEKLFKPGIIPDENWIKGSLKMRRPKGTKGRKYYNNGQGDVKLFAEHDVIPDGWVRGNPNADVSATNDIKGRKYYHCSITGNEDRFHSHAVPDGWVKGRPVRWSTNGIDNKLHNVITEVLPPGWYLGRTNKRKVHVQ